MSHQVLSRQQVRTIDRVAEEKLGIAGIVLMENAGRGCADLLISQGITPTSPVVICCGKGNNGGDGFVMARHLEVHGIPVEVLLFEPESSLTGDAAVNFQIISRIDIPIHRLQLPDDAAQLEKHLRHATWVVDALLGTGSSGAVRPPYDLVVDAINSSGRPVFAIDLPSGLDCDLGEVSGTCVHATVTGTLVAEKPGFRSVVGQEVIGQVHVLEIGIPASMITTLFGEEFSDPE